MSPKGVRKASRLAGIELDMAWNHQGTWWYGRVLDSEGRCRHLWIEHTTGEVQWEDTPMHFASCSAVREAASASV
jgi:hypothetical protein